MNPEYVGLGGMLSFQVGFVKDELPFKAGDLGSIGLLGGELLALNTGYPDRCVDSFVSCAAQSLREDQRKSPRDFSGALLTSSRVSL